MYGRAADRDQGCVSALVCSPAVLGPCGSCLNPAGLGLCGSCLNPAVLGPCGSCLNPAVLGLCGSCLNPAVLGPCGSCLNKLCSSRKRLFLFFNKTWPCPEASPPLGPPSTHPHSLFLPPPFLAARLHAQHPARTLHRLVLRWPQLPD
eukprot:350648-Chlamydomonas_euryale.AAC.1